MEGEESFEKKIPKTVTREAVHKYILLGDRSLFMQWGLCKNLGLSDIDFIFTNLEKLENHFGYVVTPEIFYAFSRRDMNNKKFSEVYRVRKEVVDFMEKNAEALEAKFETNAQPEDLGADGKFANRYLNTLFEEVKQFQEYLDGVKEKMENATFVDEEVSPSNEANKNISEFRKLLENSKEEIERLVVENGKIARGETLLKKRKAKALSNEPKKKKVLILNDEDEYE